MEVMEVIERDDQRVNIRGQSLDRRVRLSRRSIGAAVRKDISSVTILT